MATLIKEKFYQYYELKGLWTTLPRWLSQDKNFTAMTHKSRQVTGDLPLSLGREGNLIFGTNFMLSTLYSELWAPYSFSYRNKQACLQSSMHAYWLPAKMQAWKGRYKVDINIHYTCF